MEATRAPSRRNGASQHLTAFDHALIKAKTKKRSVNVTLAVTTSFTDGEGDFEATVCHVDTLSVLFNIGGRERWIFKAWFVSVTVIGDSDD